MSTGICQMCHKQSDSCSSSIVKQGLFCASCRDKLYLTAPLLNDVQYIADEKRVIIASKITEFVYICAYTPINKKNLVSLYQRVVHLAREAGVKIRYSDHVKRTIKEIWQKYVSETAEAEVLYKRILAEFENVRKRGIHIGFSDDLALTKLMVLCNKYIMYGLGTSAIYNVNSTNQKLTDYDILLSRCVSGKGNYLLDAIIL